MSFWKWPLFWETFFNEGNKLDEFKYDTVSDNTIISVHHTHESESAQMVSKKLKERFFRDTLTPSLKEVKLDTKNCIWETNFFLQDLISLRRIQNFKEIHLSIFSESIALGVTLVSDAPSNLAVPLPLFR